MAEIILTPAQQAVVENSGGALLVSAAAGSGKTRVLVDRVLRLVCDDERPANVDDFLIITYTKAAAAELRGKIAQELAKRLARDPENRHLQRQTTRLAMAQISTVHAFCAAILREYCHILDLPADFRVAEEQEAAALRQQALDGVLNECYEQCLDSTDFRALIDQLGYGRDDRRLGDILLCVYDAARCRVDPMAWMARCEAASAGDAAGAEETIWGAYLIAEYRGVLQSAQRTLARALEQMQYDAVLTEKYAPTFTQNLECVAAQLALSTWDELAAQPTMSFGTLPQARKVEDAALKERVQESRKACLASIRKAQAWFYAPSETVLRDLESSCAATRGLMEVLRRFDARYTQEKRRRKLLDFSDLEHESIRLLTQRGTTLPTAAAREIAARYCQILVDEYQDSNAVQERIFEAVSQNGENRFMVGDVKQSIYRFRLADPGIFLEKYNSYVNHTDAVPGQPRKILLSDNFRSRQQIVDCVNDVFSLVMCREAGELDYTEQEALRCARAFPDTPQPKIELHCIALDDAAPLDDESPQKNAQEAEFVAARVERLLAEKTPIADGAGTRPITPDDIVILLRSPGNVAHLYSAALARRHIPCVCDRSGDVLQTTEVEVLCALLRVVDNPHQDIPLVTALGSAVFAFSPDELALPRTRSRKGDYFDALRACAGESEKYQNFLAWLAEMRALAGRAALRELVDAILRTTQLESVFAALPDGLQRVQNLAALRAYVDRYEEISDGGLSGLNASLQQMRERGTALPPLGGETSSGAVRIMSIHRSKGLEFPVVFLADLSRKFNLQDTAKPVLVDEELLIGMNVVDTVQRSYYPSAAKMAIARHMTQQAVSEELRVLYVAMTRAQEMLIMSCCSGKFQALLKHCADAVSVPLRPEVSAAARRPIDWILLAALCRTEAGELFSLCGASECSSVRAEPWVIRLYQPDRLVRPGKPVDDSTPKPEQVTAEYLPPEYAHANVAGVPSKLTATSLKGRLPDAEAAERAAQTDSVSRPDWRKPEFLQRGAPLTGRERGSATHLFMQYVHYEACRDEAGVRAELERLVRDRFLTPQQADAVEPARIARLFAGDLGQRILQAEELRREFKFSLLMDAAAYFPQAAGEQVMLQGVVDCFWIERGELVIVDFKTDRLRDGAQARAREYAPQVHAYAQALSRIWQLPVRECILYFFDTGEAVSL